MNVLRRSIEITASKRTLVYYCPEGQLMTYSVEKLCFEMSDAFNCDLSDIAYCRY